MGEDVNKDLLEGDLERDFYSEVKALEEFKESSETDYLKELENIKMTSEVGNNYLDNTMINVDDENLKANRIAMLNILARRIEEIFDVKELAR